MEQNNKVTTKVQSMTKQKVVLVLAVFGLIGFGFVFAVASPIGTKTISALPSEETYTLKATSVGELKTLAQEAIQKHDSSMPAEEAAYQAENVIQALENQSENPQMMINIKCGGCGFSNRIGACVAGGCVGGGFDIPCTTKPWPPECKFKEAEVSITWRPGDWL